MRRNGNNKEAPNKGDGQPRNDADKKRTYEKPLAIRGTLDDVLRAAMNVKPKDEQVKANQP